MELFFIFMCFVLSVASSHPIHGAITLPFADEAGTLSIVAYSRKGPPIDVAPVTHDASFTFHDLGMLDGDYVLHVLGTVREDFDPQFVRIVGGRIAVVEYRHDPLTLLDSISSDGDGNGNTTHLNFTPSRNTNYNQKKQPWKLWHLWAYRIRFLQLAAVAFVIWFPQFIRSLPKELRNELMGEVDDDLGDTTGVFRALSGHKEPDHSQSAPSSSSKR